MSTAPSGPTAAAPGIGALGVTSAATSQLLLLPGLALLLEDGALLLQALRDELLQGRRDQC
eukprot:7942108-Lingulodinium_polyedra.AAC.1